MSLGKITVKINTNVEGAVKKVTTEIFRRVIQGTPVGDPTYWTKPAPPGYVGGRAKGNWQASTGAPIRNEIDRIDGDGSDTVADALAKITPGSVMYLSNNVPYIRRLEYDFYSPRQAPAGWVRIAIQSVAGSMKL
jgi:hypothetical protein